MDDAVGYIFFDAAIMALSKCIVQPVITLVIW